MAQLKDSVVSGNLRVTDSTLTDTLQVTTIKAPTSSGGTTYGPGTSGQVLKSNGSSVYWTSDSNTDEKVKVTANTTTKGYLIASTTSPNGTAVEGIADTGVYLGTTAGSLYATTFYGDLSGNATSATTASKLGSSTVGSTRRPIYLNSGTATEANYMVSHFGNAGKSNMNDVGKMFASVGMANLSDPGNTVDNPMNGTTKSTSWHLYWDACYIDDPNGSNSWVAQIANKAGTAQWWVRSRKGGTITNGTEWDAGWEHLTITSQAGAGSATNPVYVDSNGHTQACTYSLNKTVPSDAKFTDENVLQSDTSSTSDFRPILLGTTHTTTVADLSATITGQAYVSSNIFVKPNTGIICAEEFSTLSYINGTGAHLEQYGLYLKSYKAAALPAGGNYSYKGYVVRTYDGKSANNGGMLLTMDGGGLTIIGSGSAVALADLISDDQQDSNTSRTRLNIGGTLNTAYHGSSEYLILSSNKNIVFLTNCSTIADRKPVVLDTALRFYPGTTETGSIGISSYQWNTIYGKTIYENGTSLASKYAPKTHTHDYLPLSGGKMTGTIQGTYTNTHIALAGGGIGDYATLDNKNNINISSWNGVSISNGCSSVGTLDQVTFSVNARTGTTQQRGNAILYSESGNSPALIFQRGTFLDNVYDWRIYVNGGNLYFEHSITSSSSTQSWVQDMMFLANDKRLKVTSATENTTPCFFVERSDTSASVWFGIGSGGVNHGIFSGSINSWVFVANATEAQTYNIAKNPSTATTYAISFGGETFTTGLKSHYVNDGLRYRTREGVANTEGLSILVLGNGLASSVANNKTGYVRQYSTNEYYTDLKPNTLTASRTILLPDAAGTIAVFPAARTSGQVVVTDGTAGAVKSSGYTIAKSVPSNAKFTDENVKQSETTTNQYRPIVFGATYSTDTSTLAATITGQTYVSNLLYAQPEGGILYANRMYLKAPGSKGQLNLLTSKYNVMLRNDDSNTYFLVTAQNDPTGPWTSARPLTINNSTGVCNINGTSSSWATARTLTLGGQLTGSVSVKGDANMTLNGYLDRAFIYDDNDVPSGHTWAEYAWHKFAEVTITGIYEDRVITFLVSRTHGSSAEHTGILSAKFRTNRSVSYDSAQLKWLVRNSGLSKDDFVMVYTSTSGTSTKVELWCRLPDQYHGLVFTVLKEHQRHHSTDTSWTLVKTPDGTGSTHGSSSYPTTGITGTIISSDGTITNSTTGTANRATYLDVVSSNEIRFYNNNQFTANDRFWIGYSWAQGSHYTPSGGSDTSSTTAPNITKFIMGNCSAGGLASVHAKTFILGNGSSPTYSSKTTTITTAATTTDRTITLPDASGTIAVFPAARTSGQVVVTDGTAGAVKSSGYTIATSVPSGAKFTDEKVTQTAVGSTYTNYRPIVISSANSATEGFSPSTTTDGTFITSSLYCQPSSGMLHANIFKAGKPKTTDGAVKGQMKFFSGNASDATGTVTLECVNDAARTGDYTVKLPTWNGTIPVFEKLFDGALSTVSLSYSDIDEYDLFLITVANSNATSEQVTVASLWISNVVGVHDMPLIWGGTPSSSGGACNVTSGWIQLSKNSGTTTFSVAHKSKVAQMTNSGWSISSPTYNLYIRKIFGLKAFKRT